MPDDPKIKEIDPYQKLLLFESWMEERRERAELDKNLGYLVGSFINPEAVRKLMDAEANTFASSDEEFDALSQSIVEQNRKKEEQKTPRRKRKKRVVSNG